MQILVQQIMDPTQAIVLGGTWRVPVMEELLRKTFIQELKLDGEPSVSAVRNFATNQWGIVKNINYANGEV